MFLEVFVQFFFVPQAINLTSLLTNAFDFLSGLLSLKFLRIHFIEKKILFIFLHGFTFYTFYFLSTIFI